MDDEQSFGLNKNVYRIGKLDEGCLQRGRGKSVTWQERLRIAHYLTSVAYNLPVDSWPRMDKAIFQIKKR